MKKAKELADYMKMNVNNSNETFRFSNYSNGKTKTIEINKMHSIPRIN